MIENGGYMLFLGFYLVFIVNLSVEVEFFVKMIELVVVSGVCVVVLVFECGNCLCWIVLLLVYYGVDMW